MLESSHNQKSHVAPQFDCLDLGNTCCHWWCHWCHLKPVPMASHEQKSHVTPHFSFLDLRTAMVPLWKCQCDMKRHVAPHFYCLDLSNAMLPLTIPSVSHDADTSANYITCWKESCCTSFHLFWPKECNGAIYDAISIVWCWCWCQWHHMAKEVMLYIILITFA